MYMYIYVYDLYIYVYIFPPELLKLKVVKFTEHNTFVNVASQFSNIWAY